MLKELKTQHREIARLAFEGYRAEDISKRMNLAVSTVRGIMSDHLFKAYVEKLNDRADENVIDVRKRLAEMNEYALDTIEKMLVEDGIPANVALKAAESVLDRTGYKAPERHEHIHGHFTKDDIEALKRRAREASLESRIIEAEIVN